MIETLLKPRLLLTILSRKKKTFFLSLLLFIFVCIALISGFNVVSSNFQNKHVTEGIVGTYAAKDLPENVTKLLSRGLVSLDPSGMPSPDLAETIQMSEDGKKYTVKLKENLFWSDGTKLSAYEISQILPDVAMQVIDERTLEFSLNDVYSPFPTLLIKPIFKKTNINLNEESLSSQDVINAYLGVGPYKLTGVNKDDTYLKSVGLEPVQKNDLPFVTIKFYPTEKIVKNAFKLGEVQSVIGAQDLNELTDPQTTSLYQKTNYAQLVTIFYNTKDPILSDDNFRQALSYASPSIQNETEAKTSIPPTSWAFSQTTKDYLDNPEAAKVAFDKVQNGKDSTITLTATSFLGGVGEKVVEAWKQSGIKASLKVESGVPQDFQALLITQNIPLDPDQYALWHSTQMQTNISKYADPKVSPRIDKDLEDARKTSDLNLRKERYADFQKVLMDASPATFLYFPKLNVVYLKKVEEPLKKVLDIQMR